MPSMYALRSSSSSSSSTTASKPPFPAHQSHGISSAPVHVPAAPLPPTGSRAIPAFLKSANRALTSVIPVTSAQPILSKSGVDPPDEAAHGRLEGTSALNYSSSGSPHDPSTVCLAAMVHEFLEEEIAVGNCGRTRCNCLDGVCGDEENCIPADEPEPHMVDEQLCEILEGMASSTSKQELLLLVDVARAAEAETEESIAGDSAAAVADRVRRVVMMRLRQEGYNAAICKSRWKNADGLPSGDYEYIDVLVDGKPSGSKKQERFIVDLDFRSQFEIARGSRQYAQLLSVLPKLYVGRVGRLKQIVKIMANAAKRSLKEQSLLLPPWRKHKYMQAKWFSPYRRTTNAEPLCPTKPCSMLGVGFRAPTTFTLDFTKEMDLLFYKVQVKGLNNIPQLLCNQHFPERDVLCAYPSGGDMVISEVNMASGVPGLAYNAGGITLPCQDMGIVIMCTDWQLPAVEAKLRSNKDRVSGISTAFKQASLLPNQ